eukprot:8838995-Pyramimonas_sp.AAC.1
MEEICPAHKGGRVVRGLRPTAAGDALNTHPLSASSWEWQGGGHGDVGEGWLVSEHSAKRRSDAARSHRESATVSIGLSGGCAAWIGPRGGLIDSDRFAGRLGHSDGSDWAA